MNSCKSQQGAILSILRAQVYWFDERGHGGGVRRNLVIETASANVETTLYLVCDFFILTLLSMMMQSNDVELDSCLELLQKVPDVINWMEECYKK